MAATSRFFAAAEASVLGGALLVSGNLTHLTWWAIALLASHDLVIAVSGTVSQRLWLVSMTLSTLVQSVVILMSLLKCNLLRQAYGDVGPWTYMIGNFVLHYWPTLRLVASRPLSMQRPATVRFDAARLLAVYATLQEPTSVYMCRSIAPWTAMPLGVLATVIIEQLYLRLCD